VLSLARYRNEVAVVDDQWGDPTFAADLAAAIMSIGDKLASVDDGSQFYTCRRQRHATLSYDSCCLETFAARGQQTFDLLYTVGHLFRL
jgi:dTDP-4-dehydrorhamnose reductase